jgi:hypothetical protein
MSAIRYRLIELHRREADWLDWAIVGYPTCAVTSPDGEAKFWPTPVSGLRMKKDEKGYFFDLQGASI